MHLLKWRVNTSLLGMCFKQNSQRKSFGSLESRKDQKIIREISELCLRGKSMWKIARAPSFDFDIAKLNRGWESVLLRLHLQLHKAWLNISFDFHGGEFAYNFLVKLDVRL